MKKERTNKNVKIRGNGEGTIKIIYKVILEVTV